MGLDEIAAHILQESDCMLRGALFGIGILMVQAPGVMAQRGLVSRPTVAPILHPAPLGVTVSGRAPQIAIVWQPVPGALDYAVLRSVDPAQPGIPVSPGGLTTPSFVDQTAAPGTVYFYTVTARFAGGPATASPPVRFDPPLAIVKSGHGVRPQTRAGGSTAPANDGLPAITGVSDTIIPVGGPPVTIRGRNLWDVTGVYFGTGAPGSWSNPKIVPTLVSTAGDAVQVSAPSGCVTRGVVMLEQYGDPGADPKYITYVTQNPAAPPVRLNCAGKPVVLSLGGGGNPGSSMVIQGAYLSWVNRVTNLVDGAALSFQVVSDNQLWVTIPRFTIQQYPHGLVWFQPNLISPLGSSALSRLTFWLPPTVTSAGGPVLTLGQITPVEPGGALEINGLGFDVGWVAAHVTVDGRPAAESYVPHPYATAVTVPAGTANGTFVLSTIGGSVSGTFTLMTGPSRLTGVSPVNAPVGGRVTVTGDNIFRARGVCFADPASTPVSAHGVVQSLVVGDLAPSWQRWSNGSVTVDVPAGVASGYLGLYIPNSPGSTAGACQWSSVTLQVP